MPSSACRWASSSHAGRPAHCPHTSKPATGVPGAINPAAGATVRSAGNVMSSVSEAGGELHAAPRREPNGAAPASRHNLLIADDSKVIRNRLVSILETLEGVELRVAVDGLEALSLAKERKP